MIDLALVLYLVVILPSMRLWRSLQKSITPRRPRVQVYGTAIREIAILLVALLLASWWSGHGAADLGLAPPDSGAALWCLLIPAILLPLLHYAGKLRQRSLNPEQLAADYERLRRDESLPRTKRELNLYLVLSVFLGAGWELLYRGFLLLALTPVMGVWRTVIIAGVAYGAAHGYTSRKQIGASIVSALLFAGGYALTGSLWWLIVLHTGLPAMTAIAYYKIINQDDGDKAQAVSP
ncbi:CPBP family intramembrane glutamic endopeptidase [Duganella callida]|uniref:CPBP family intramembrane metalloprotease n=1 Tax=Duganella callida TaxID=2561932 RepID=A0A4Y9S7Z0_9BURK|nr:CPBP family intramembrane glutamic endopeptidase [Duganella callida]TFW15650.1 CPBP family intramembrane metalloprotease [Duganella callida]